MKIAILASGGDAPGMNYVTYECFMLAKKIRHRTFGC